MCLKICFSYSDLYEILFSSKEGVKDEYQVKFHTNYIYRQICDKYVQKEAILNVFFS